MLDVTVIGAATAPDNTQMGKLFAFETCIVPPERCRVADIEFRGFVEFRVAHGRRVGPKPANPVAPRLPGVQHMLKMARMGAIDHVVQRIT